jgi:hypothetical protein
MVMLVFGVGGWALKCFACIPSELFHVIRFMLFASYVYAHNTCPYSNHT